MQRHVVLTLGRSGSNTLVNLLNQHPNALNIGEVLGKWNRVRQIRDRLNLYPNDTSAYLDGVSRKSGLLRGLVAGRTAGRWLRLKPREAKPLGRIKTLGFKEFATLMSEHGQENWPQTRHDVKVIGLLRDDVLGRFVSWQLLNQTGVVFHNKDGQKEPEPIDVDPTRIADHLTTISAENDLLKKTLNRVPEDRVYKIRYDEFYSSEPRRKKIIDEVFRFLDLPHVSTSIRMNKIVKRPPAQMIRNRGECAAALVGTKFEGILDHA
ncbi:sulfotransferase domain-containing protein [Paracoccus sp. Z330]|uniref:Sulfotransferase domain-containing protein n=1 Tax=Paracoccus onchidii TaxID=3017813 RepID=A0ABT4ZES5_9RHOB|nr:sulfotransferase domain-containing protein [Paracoccus onchidii]MDB6177884.1 sulfotransferase domain-containing protein [Paracoccus onchidii]